MASRLTMTPDEALIEMRAGNKRFLSGSPSHANTSLARVSETAIDGQRPFVTLIACSDSRVPVELIFDQGIGDVFVIRVAGNVCNIDEIGSIEFGVDRLGTPLMVVLGHTQCGAVTAVATGAEVHGNIPALVGSIAPAVLRAKQRTGKQGKDVVEDAIVENVWQSISDLFNGSHTTVALVSDGKLKVIGAVYDVSNGTVRWLGEHPEQEGLLSGGVHDAE